MCTCTDVCIRIQSFSYGGDAKTAEGQVSSVNIARRVEGTDRPCLGYDCVDLFSRDKWCVKGCIHELSWMNPINPAWL